MASHAHAAHDSHAAHGEEHHGHHITPAFVLKGILGLLLLFTVLTVGQAQAEQWIAHTFDIVLPNWLNVVVVMGIATVKATLVLLYFMHLRHDNPINAVIFGFTVLGVAIFLFFTFLDIGNRGYIDEEKHKQVKTGGSGEGVIRMRKYPAYANVHDEYSAFSGQVYIGAVEVRIQEIEEKYLPKVHPAIMNPRAAELTAKPSEAVLKLVAQAEKDGKYKPVDEAARQVAFDETIAKARDLVAADVAKDFIAEFEYHLHHGKMPHAEVLKAIQTRLGPATFAKVKQIADEHFAAHATHGLAGGAEQSSRNFSRAKKNITSGLFEADAEAPAAHGSH